MLIECVVAHWERATVISKEVTDNVSAARDAELGLRAVAPPEIEPRGGVELEEAEEHVP